MKNKLALILVFMLICFTGCSSDKSSSGSPSPSSSPSSSSSQQSSSGSSSGGQSSSDSAKTGNITVSGSTAIQPLLTQAVGTFKNEKKFTGSIIIDGGGSIKGIADVASGIVDIGCSDISPLQAGKDGTGLVDHQVAVVAVGIVVSSDVSANLKEISTTDLKGIFTGQITDWKQVAGWKGVSLPIAVYYEKPGSGVRYIFETFGIMTTLTDAQIGALKNFTEIKSPVMLQTALESVKGAIGYAALPYCTKYTLLKVDSIEASYENVYSGKYKIWGCEHMYTKGEPVGAAKAFIEYLSSQEFQKTVTSSGYGVITEMKVSR